MFAFHHCMGEGQIQKWLFIRMVDHVSWGWLLLLTDVVFFGRGNTEVELFNLDDVLFAIIVMSKVLLLWFYFLDPFAFHHCMRKQFDKSLLMAWSIAFVTHGCCSWFFHGNEAEIQKFKPDCVIVCYHHIVDDRPSYIIYTYINFWFYRSVDVPWRSSIFLGQPVLLAIWCVVALRPLLPLYFVKFKLDVASKYHIMLTDWRQWIREKVAQQWL